MDVPEVPTASHPIRKFSHVLVMGGGKGGIGMVDGFLATIIILLKKPVILLSIKPEPGTRNLIT